MTLSVPLTPEQVRRLVGAHINRLNDGALMMLPAGRKDMTDRVDLYRTVEKRREGRSAHVTRRYVARGEAESIAHLLREHRLRLSADQMPFGYA